MTSFEDLGIRAGLIDAMTEMGWSEPTPVQCEAVPVGIAGNDLLVKAQTGTGKTGAYAMIVMSRIGKGSKVPSALVITPTRELAMQVDTELMKLSKKTGHISTAVYGGAPIDRQIYALRRGSDIIVGTPGRLKDMLERDALDLSQITEVVFDEADRMLDMGFEDDLDFIMEHVPAEHQTLMFSATMNDDVRELVENMLENPCEVDISGDTPTTGLTKQYIINCKKNEKKSVLYEVLARGHPKSIVFFATKVMVDEVYREMKEDGVKVGTLHGDMPQKLRERVIGDFRDNHLLTLLATDVAARGLDVTDVDLVVNYDLPIDPETYLHRIGRTGRAGKEGISVSIVHPRDRKLVRMCEEEADAVMERIEPEDIEPIEAEHEPVYRHAKKEQKMKVEKHRNNDRRNKFADEREGFATIEINLGKADNLNRSDIADFLKQRAGLTEDAIGKVGLKDDCSFVEVSLDHSDYILENLTGCDFNGKTVNITLAPRKERYHGDASAEGDNGGFDRRRENRYKNFEKRRAREAEESEDVSEEGSSEESKDEAVEEAVGSQEDEEMEVFDEQKDYVEEQRNNRSRSSGYNRAYGEKHGGFGHDRRSYGRRDDRRGGYGRDRGYGGRRDYGDRPRRSYGDREYVHRDFEGKDEAEGGEQHEFHSDRGERREGGYRDRGDRRGGYGHRDDGYGRRDDRRGGYGDRPRRDYGDRPRREYSDRDGGEGSERPRYSDRGERREGGYRDRGDRRGGYGHRDGGYGRRDDRRGGYGDRPRREYGERREGGYRDRGDRPSREGSDDSRPRRYPSNRDTPRTKRYPSNRDTPRKRKDSRY